MKKKHYYKYIKAKVRIDCHLVIQSLQTLKDEGINNGGVPMVMATKYLGHMGVVHVNNIYGPLHKD